MFAYNMNWACLRYSPWLDTRAAFVFRVPPGGRLLDLGSSDGETLRHMAELRPDLKLCCVDIEGSPERYPPGCEFVRADLVSDSLPWSDASMDAITCMHLVEHLSRLDHIAGEAGRLLKPGGRAYFETPHLKTLDLPPVGRNSPVPFTMNFYDDPTHIRPVTVGELQLHIARIGLETISSGVSRNWLFALSHLAYAWLPASRKKFTARAHWLGWSAYLIAEKRDSRKDG